MSASLGDNLGFWAGRRYGRRAVARLPLPPARVAQAQGFIARYGARAVFVARFVPGLRTVAGPLAGSGGPPPLRFCAANLLGAICYVPWPVLAGYDVGYGLGDWVERLRRAAGLTEDAALFPAILAVAALAFTARMSDGRRQNWRTLRDVLAQMLGYSEDRIAALLASKAVEAPQAAARRRGPSRQKTRRSTQ